MYDPNGLIINIDGSAYKNPGHKGGIAAIAEFPEALNREPECIFEIGFSETTNNRMELHATIRALEWARKNARALNAQSVTIVSDSLYVCNNHKNAPYWKKAKWRNRDDRPIENADLWDRLLSAKNKVGVRTEIEWQKGKVSAVAKEVDKKAKTAAHATIQIKDIGYRPGKISRTKINDGSASMFLARGQEEIIRIYRKDFKFRGTRKDAKIFFDLFSKGTRSYVSKEFAYTTLENEDELHRGHAYRVKFGSNPKYPIIQKLIREIKRL